MANLPVELLDLPEELLVKILCKVRVIDLLRHVSVSCKQMRRLALSYDVMREVNVSEEDFSSSAQLYTFFSTFKQFKSVKVSVCDQPTAGPSLAAVGNPRASEVLSSLQVKNLQVKLKVGLDDGPSRTEIEKGECSVKGVENLKIVNYYGEFLQNQQFTASIITSNFQTLTCIRLKEMSQNEFCRIVLDSLPLCKNLKFLRLPINNIDFFGLLPSVFAARIDINAEFEDLSEFKAARHAPQIRDLHIHLNYVHINEATRQVLMTLPRLFPSVRKLRLTGSLWRIEVKWALRGRFNV